MRTEAMPSGILISKLIGLDSRKRKLVKEVEESVTGVVREAESWLSKQNLEWEEKSRGEFARPFHYYFEFTDESGKIKHLVVMAGPRQNFNLSIGEVLPEPNDPLRNEMSSVIEINWTKQDEKSNLARIESADIKFNHLLRGGDIAIGFEDVDYSDKEEKKLILKNMPTLRVKGLDLIKEAKRRLAILSSPATKLVSRYNPTILDYESVSKFANSFANASASI